jgi:uncharacterized membrane protein YdfJ with MMPL/SSD domain
MNSAFRDDTDIELDEIRASEQPSTHQHARMPKNTRRVSEESLKSNVSVTVHSVETENDGRMENEQNSKHDRRNFVIGILLLLLVVFLWTSSNFITQVLKIPVDFLAYNAHYWHFYRICSRKDSTNLSW